jgi:hypothetical protein
MLYRRGIDYVRYLSVHVTNRMVAFCIFAALAGGLRAGPIAFVGYLGGSFGAVMSAF